MAGEDSFTERVLSACVCILGQILLMASCPRVAPAAGMAKRTGKMGPQPPLLHLTQSTLVGQLGTYSLFYSISKADVKTRCPFQLQF